MRCKLRVGEPELHDISVQTGKAWGLSPAHAARALTTRALQAFAKMFTCTPDDLDMHVVYDVSHNIAKARRTLRRIRAATPLTRRLAG